MDLERHLLQVRRTVLRVRAQGLVAKEPKTRAGQRVLRIPFWLVQLLRERHARAAVSEGPVFPDRRGGYRDRNNIESDYGRFGKGRTLSVEFRTSIARRCSTRAGSALG